MRNEVAHHLTGKMFSQGWGKAVFSVIGRKVSPVTVGSSKKERNDNFVFHQSSLHIDLQWITFMYHHEEFFSVHSYCAWKMQSVEVWHCIYMPRRWPWPSKKLGSYTKWTSTQFNISFHFMNILFYCHFKTKHPIYIK
jgi:hypothetical protein